MPKEFIHKAFEQWIYRNLKRFKYQPLIFKRRKDYIQLKFSGITSEILCHIDKRGQVLISIEYQDQCWDIIAEFDVAEKRSAENKYYCELCLPEYRVFYSSKQELWEKHSFEPLLEWINENFLKSQWVCLFGGGETGFTIAKLREKQDVSKMTQDKYFFCAFPVVLI